MEKHKTSRQLTLSGVLIAIGLLLPFLFHLIKNGGEIFLPMHLPVVLGGFFLTPIFAGAVGVLTPLLSSILMGMPAFPFAYIMFIELAAYGLIISLFYAKGKRPVFLSLIIGMLGGRLVRILASYLLLPLLTGMPFSFSLIGSAIFITGLPGIILQLIIIPVLVYRVKKYYQEK